MRQALLFGALVRGHVLALLLRLLRLLARLVSLDGLRRHFATLVERLLRGVARLGEEPGLASIPSTGFPGA